MLGLDNMSHISRDISDVLCGVSTGSGNGSRTLYSNDGETLLKAIRPVILNSIADVVAEHADLQDRAISIHLSALPDAARKTTVELWQEFDEIRPRVLGALLSAASQGLKNIDTTVLAELPRLADFALFATAAEEGLGLQPGEFMEAYRYNKAQAAQTTVESSALGQCILNLKNGWKGTAFELLKLLRLANIEDVRGLPRSPRALSDSLARIEPVLRSLGVDVTRDRTRDARIIEIKRRDKQEVNEHTVTL
jgi:hypothetical protein